MTTTLQDIQDIADKILSTSCFQADQHIIEEASQGLSKMYFYTHPYVLVVGWIANRELHNVKYSNVSIFAPNRRYMDTLVVMKRSIDK